MVYHFLSCAASLHDKLSDLDIRCLLYLEENITLLQSLQLGIEKGSSLLLRLFIKGGTTSYFDY